MYYPNEAQLWVPKKAKYIIEGVKFQTGQTGFYRE